MLTALAVARCVMQFKYGNLKVVFFGVFTIPQSEERNNNKPSILSKLAFLNGPFSLPIFFPLQTRKVTGCFSTSPSHINTSYLQNSTKIHSRSPLKGSRIKSKALMLIIQLFILNVISVCSICCVSVITFILTHFPALEKKGNPVWLKLL